mgnify:CR=1 FL=1
MRNYEIMFILSTQLTDEEKQVLKNYQLLTLKPMIFAAKVVEDDLATGNKYVDLVKDYAEKIGSEVVIVSAKVEAELQEMDDESKKEFLETVVPQWVKEAKANGKLAEDTATKQ